MSVCSSHLAAPHSVQLSANSRQWLVAPPATNHVLVARRHRWTLDDGHQVVMQRLGVGDLVGVNPLSISNSPRNVAARPSSSRSLS